MIAERENHKTVHGNLTGAVHEMGIDAEYMGHVMGMLAGLYADKFKACVREYSCNARDAMVKAKRGGDPIDVLLPGALSPFLTIKDTGVGMDEADIQRTYSRYGASTKRDNNDEVGKFGIGSKAAMAYADQFTLVGTKDGQRIQVAIARTTDGGGSMTVVSTAPTTEPNGVEIVIPIKTGDIDTFRERANTFFQYWEPNTVLVDGSAPKSFTEDAIPITKDMWVVDTRGGDRDDTIEPDVVIMGNVPYPCKLNTGLGWKYKVVARVPIGSVDIPPSRESLKKDHAGTQAYLRALADTYGAEAGKAVQAFIEKAESKHAAMLARERWATALEPRTDREYKWKGDTLPTRIYALDAVCCGSKAQSHAKDWNDDPTFDSTCAKCTPPESQFWTTRVRTGDNEFMARRTLPLSQLDDALSYQAGRYYNTEKYLIVEGYDRGDKPTATAKKKLMQYIDRKYRADGITTILMFRELHQRNIDALTWIPAIKTVQWADVWAEKLPRTAHVTAQGKPERAYPVAYPPPADYEPSSWSRSYGESGRFGGVKIKDVPADELPPKPIYANSSKDNARVAALRCNEPVVYLTAPREAKFLRENKGARKAAEVCKARQEKFLKKLSLDYKRVLKKTSRYDNDNPFKGWACLLAHNISDPEVSELARLGKLDIAKLIEELRDLGLYHYNVDTGGVPDIIDPRHHYPLLEDHIDNTQVEHAVLYINAVHAAQAKGV